MRRIYKMIGGMLTAGVLIAGIGSGVVFEEYSSFEYGGEVTLEGSGRFTKTVEYKLPKKSEADSKGKDSEGTESATEKLTANEDTSSSEEVVTETEASLEEEENVLNISVGWRNYTVVEDEDVPKDVVRFDITYLSDNRNVSPAVKKDIIENEGEKYEYLYVDTDFYHNEFRNVMRVKDLIMSDLKNHCLSDYQLDGVEQVQVYVNPKADFSINMVNDIINWIY